MTVSGPDPNDRPPAAIANGRLGRIVRGYVGACFVASWGLALGLILEDIVAGHRVSIGLTDFAVVVAGFFLVVLVAAAPLATAAIVATESFQLLTIGPFILIGGVIAVVVQAAARIIMRTHTGTEQGAVVLLAAFVGALSGCVYWFLAVRGSRPIQRGDLP